MLRYIILSLACIFGAFSTMAQSSVSISPVSIYLNYGGTFQFDDGSGYKILDFGDKSDQSLYENMMMNVLFFYNQPNSVVSSVEGKMIKVRGLLSDISFINNGTKCMGNAYYQIYFWIKNGKVKIHAPILETIRNNSGMLYNKKLSEIEPSELATLYGKDQTGLIELQNDLSHTINYILGLEASSQYPYLENW